MKYFLSILLAAVTFISVSASAYTYRFNNTPIAEALATICKDHPEANISFIYVELDKYKTSATINTDELYRALRQTIGLNPITVIKKGNEYYVEALQRGKYCFTGCVTGRDGEPVSAATVQLLAPRDSVVLTFGITDDGGCFTIPCDKQNVIGKFTRLGYETVYRALSAQDAVTIVMQEKSVLLDGIKVEAANAHLYSDKSVYIPTQKQKKFSQTAQDLISRMAIPQLRIGEDIVTASGRPVKVYIDYVPATEAELAGMSIDDVRKVEYYDNPIDPRFQGEAHVINFIMQKYEYGGYVKGIYYDNFVMSRQLNGYAKFQYKNMTYDWAGGGYYLNDTKGYEDTYETFRLPQSDGSVKEFERKSEVSDSRKRKDVFWTSLKALYRTKNMSISNMITADFDRTPKQLTQGEVSYTPADFSLSEYISRTSGIINSVVYSGYWYFILPHDNSLTFNPYYAYTHTNQKSSYEEGLDRILNGAVDDSHQATGEMAFVHSFGKAGTLKAMCQGRFLQNKTYYSGSSSNSDKARTYRLGPGINYSFSNDRYYLNAGVGMHWDRSEYGSIVENSTAPWAKLAFQLSFNQKNSFSLDFSYNKSIPTSSYRSASVIQANPLMSYTGNPELVPYHSSQIEANYSFVPNNKFSFSTFGFAWIVGNRYVFDYEASSIGILRTIKQPLGCYAQWQYGLQAVTRQFDSNLQIGATVYLDQAHNGLPYNWTKSKVVFSLSSYYYLKDFYFGATYNTPSGYPDGCMVGTWMSPRSSYTFQVGWSNSNWNLRLFTRNTFRDNTYQTKGVMKSKYYDSTRFIYSGAYSGFFQISATYTFSFGKKVKADNEAYQASGASSGILK